MPATATAPKAKAVAPPAEPTPPLPPDLLALIREGQDELARLELEAEESARREARQKAEQFAKEFAWVRLAVETHLPKALLPYVDWREKEYRSGHGAHSVAIVLPDTPPRFEGALQLSVSKLPGNASELLGYSVSVGIDRDRSDDDNGWLTYPMSSYHRTNHPAAAVAMALLMFEKARAEQKELDAKNASEQEAKPPQTREEKLIAALKEFVTTLA